MIPGEVTTLAFPVVDGLPYRFARLLPPEPAREGRPPQLWARFREWDEESLSWVDAQEVARVFLFPTTSGAALGTVLGVMRFPPPEQGQDYPEWTVIIADYPLEETESPTQAWPEDL